MSDNPIQRFIDRGLTITDNKRLATQTWQDYIEGTKDKKIYVWGMGALTDILFTREKDIVLSGAIDKSVSKQGKPISLYVDVSVENDCLISSDAIFMDCKAEEIAVVIASAEYADDIALTLENFGIYNYYSVLHMEANSVYDECEIVSSDVDYEIDTNKIAVWAHGGSYGGHEKYICEELLKLSNKLDIVWITSDMSINVPDGIRLVFMGNKERYSKELKTAKIWISSSMIPREIKKKKNQIFIEVKHWASITLKKFYLDAPSVGNIKFNQEHWSEKGAEMDYIFVGSEFDEQSCRRGFSNTAKFIHIGSCRTDAMFKTENFKEKVCAQYGLDEKDKILVYAPTYRFEKNGASESHAVGNIDIDLVRLIDSLQKKYQCKWKVMLRLHPCVRTSGAVFAQSKDIIDASEYPDSQELCAACDMLISDYSSIMFEPAFVEKPVMLYAPDRDLYIDKEYELLIDYDTLPFPIAETNEELVSNIAEFDNEKYVKTVDAFMDKYGVHEDGHASERAAKFIWGLLH